MFLKSSLVKAAARSNLIGPYTLRKRNSVTRFWLLLFQALLCAHWLVAGDFSQDSPEVVLVDASPTAIATARNISLGAFVWYNYYGYTPPHLYSHYPAEIARLRQSSNVFRSVRTTYLPQPPPPNAPVGASRVDMAKFVSNQYSKGYLTNAQNQSAWLDAAGANNRTVLISWNPPDTYTATEQTRISRRARRHTRTESAGTTKVLPSTHVVDYARYLAASVNLLVNHGVRLRFVELSNEPDGDWNTRIFPKVYNLLVKAARAEFDALGLHAVGLVGPGTYVMNEAGRWWPGKNLSASDYFNALDGEAVRALAAFSTHTYDDVLVPNASVQFVNAQMKIFFALARATDPSKPVLATEMGVATDHLATGTFRHDVKHDCYSDTGDDMYPDAEALNPGYAARLGAYLLLHFSNGFDIAQAWELGDVSGIGKAHVGCFGLFDRLGAPKPAGAVVELLLAAGGDRVLARTWQDTTALVTGAFTRGVDSFTQGVDSAVVVAMANAGDVVEQRLVRVVGGGVAVTVAGSYNCNASMLTGVRATSGHVDFNVTVPPSCVVIFQIPIEQEVNRAVNAVGLNGS